MNGPIIDACPACPPGDVPAAQPRGIYQTADGHLSAGYECPACGRKWRTTWEVETAWPVRRADTSGAVTELLDELISVLAGLLADEPIPAAKEIAS